MLTQFHFHRLLVVLFLSLNKSICSINSAITAGTKKNLEAAEMWFYRRMLRISWKEKRTNESILEETNPHKNNKEKATEIFRPHMSP